ncbi:succinate--CoA ligase subunit beta [Rickettsia bellii]|uniref:Succinate--CoA ligase [ADP-forming] subunit beta n=3 Tax=Rickettsia bellii TaxID=33990 RepID=SUCC_RICBR|nr:ADP-forming succinate--CoA ligase subunit beta [Rickettsia bellii]Q1RH55.1 RecName: Full=Succinate--CoA ligase [ADP-forming] subunit beta; AltName: Full=Succinyl-CoA synthetase subunit beta; Short=SCS-beta [Rickettsia bellii RML369-C]ABE05309.1 Succinyl-CoA synthetase beta chain [Rickettsia bellii RML369-C]ARD86161.1 succinate--CoA ligase subunit beta [Rickettsia bellii]KJV90338.1 succinate-CoA ligase, beta subunit [Rickettsia bellii str. RML An4]KJV92835.1 succinate-CoA ligase, beta subuni
MNIHEYQAKEILRKYGVPTSTGVVVTKTESINAAIDELNTKVYVVKAQIHAGGRGKAGGVKVVKSKEEAKKVAHDMFGINLVTHQTGPQGQKVNRLYIESGCDILKEYYFSVVFDRSASCITFIASTEGGVDIEEVAEKTPEKIIKFSVDPATGLQNFHAQGIAYELGFKDHQVKQMKEIVKATYKAFIETDAAQIEINPLIVNKEGNLLALDAKFTFDDNGLFKHPEIMALRDQDEEDPLETRAADAGLSYVKMDGSIGCMVNGAGLAMATMDIIKLYGATPANFLDVGGGADRERVKEALKIILSDKEVKGILVNIFGGIMRCDIIAEGIIAAAKDIGIKVPLVVRLAGTNVEKGKEILSNSGLEIIPAHDLADAASKIVEAI